MLKRRTDLALEAKELWTESAEKETKLEGVRARDSLREGYQVTTVDILDEQGASSLGKPVGSYVTVQLDALARREEDAFGRAARAIAADCGCAVLLKGGHSDTDADDLLTFPDGTEIWFPGKRIANPNTHGTGCTLSSAIAANLAKGFALEEAIARAKAYLTDALNAQLDLGRGSGPLDHALGGVGVENWMHGVPDAVHK